MFLLLLGGSWAHFSHFFAFFSHFGRILNHHGIFLRSFSIFFNFLSILDGFGEDFGRVLGGFFDVFWIFFLTANFVKYSVLPGKNHYICYVARLKNNEKSTKMRRKSDANLG